MSPFKGRQEAALEQLRSHEIFSSAMTIRPTVIETMGDDHPTLPHRLTNGPQTVREGGGRTVCRKPLTDFRLGT
jgi:hypothetical protein